MKLFIVMLHRGDSVIKGIFKDRKNAVDYIDLLISQGECERSLSIREIESDFSLLDFS